MQLATFSAFRSVYCGKRLFWPCNLSCNLPSTQLFKLKCTGVRVPVCTRVHMSLGVYEVYDKFFSIWLLRQ